MLHRAGILRGVTNRIDLRETQKLGYELKSLNWIPEKSVNLYHFRHACGAEHVHVASSDANNTFGVTLQTPVGDDRGLPHVLEHLVLCGSRKYPVRDPFFNMLSRSVNTYMNAYTASAHTTYPFSTENERDFDNLLDVYLDAVFHPLLREEDFLQEGHRLVAEAGAGGFRRSGVVYNEMKGAMSGAPSLFYDSLHRALYRGSRYAFNSGGAPRAIPRLTHDALRAFHAEHYRPDRALFYTYGCFDPLPSMRRIVRQVLEVKDEVKDEVKATTRISVKASSWVSTAPARTRRAAEPFTHCATAPALPGLPAERQSRVSVGWVTDSVSGSESADDGSFSDFDGFCLSLACALLTDGPSAPLYRALIEGGLGADFAPATGHDASASQPCVSFGVSEAAAGAEAAERIEAAVLGALRLAATDGFDVQRAEGMLQQLELAQREVRGGFGRALLWGVVSAWQHGHAPADALRTRAHVARLRLEWGERGAPLQRVLRRQLLDNAHRCTLRVDADPQFFTREESREREQLAEDVRRESATGDGVAALRERLRAQEVRLERHQHEAARPELVAALPRVALGDMPSTARDLAAVDVRAPAGAGARQPTNGVVHAHLWLPLPLSPFSLDSDSSSEGGTDPVVQAPLMALALGNLGAGAQSFREFSDRLDRWSGGLGVSARVLVGGDGQRLCAALRASTRFLSENSGEAAALLRSALFEPRFDEPERFQLLLRQRAAELREAVPSAGHQFALLRAAASLGAAHALRERWRGMPLLAALDAAAEAPEEALTALERAYQLARAKGEWHALLVAERPEEALAALSDDQANAGRWAARGGNLPGTLSEPPPGLGHAGAAAAAVDVEAIDASVSYAAAALPAPPPYAAGRGHLMVLNKLLTLQYLHPQIREVGGAYGAGCTLRGDSIGLYSYRDPQPERSLDVFAGCAAWVRAGGTVFDPSRLEEAKVRVLADLDASAAPGARGVEAFALGTTQAQVDALRREVFHCTSEDLVHAADAHFDESAMRRVILKGNKDKS